MKTKLFLTGLALVAFMTISYGQNTKVRNGNGKGVNKTTFVDKNGNRTCDNYEQRTAANQQNRKFNRQGNGSEKGQNAGQGNRKGRKQNATGAGFIDKNNNGICDNQE